MAAALVIGVIVAQLRASSLAPIRWSAYAYVEFFRSIPILLLIYWLYSALPVVTGISLNPYLVGLVSFALNYGAFASEIFRAGNRSIDVGQRYAGLSIGMDGFTLWRRVLLPQVFRRIVPPIGSRWVGLFKDSSLLFGVTVGEVMYRSREIAILTFRPLEIYTFAAIVYFVITWPQARLVDHAYERTRIHA
jgi:polar amino acid transport system permease protein